MSQLNKAVVWWDFNGVVQDDHLEAPYIRWKIHPSGPVSVRGVDTLGEHLWSRLYIKVFKVELEEDFESTELQNIMDRPRKD